MSPLRDRAPRGARRHLVTLTGPAAPVPNNDGGWTETRLPLDPPTWFCRIDPASVRDLDFVTAGTTIARASHILEGSYHPGITTATEITFRGRVFYVNGVINPEERNSHTIAFCEEQVPH
jgi:head-tail adaptor